MRVGIRMAVVQMLPAAEGVPPSFQGVELFSRTNLGALAEELGLRVRTPVDPDGVECGVLAFTEGDDAVREVHLKRDERAVYRPPSGLVYS